MVFSSSVFLVWFGSPEHCFFFSISSLLSFIRQRCCGLGFLLVHNDSMANVLGFLLLSPLKSFWTWRELFKKELAHSAGFSSPPQALVLTWKK